MNNEKLRPSSQSRLHNRDGLTCVGHYATVMLSTLGFVACATTGPKTPAADATYAAVEAYAKAARLIHYGDWVGYEDDIDNVFTAEELSILANHLDSLEGLITSTLTTRHSIYGAKLAGYFQLEECYEPIRRRILTPTMPYGWEGTDASGWSGDHQFQYQTAYVAAISDLRRMDFANALDLKPEEMEQLQSYLDDGLDWAEWLVRNLEYGPEPIGTR